MSNKFEDLINAAKVSELLHKKELEEKNKNTIVIVLAVLGAIAAVAYHTMLHLRILWSILEMRIKQGV